MNDGGVGPGMGAFTVFFILAIVLWLLMRNMNACGRPRGSRTSAVRGSAA